MTNKNENIIAGFIIALSLIVLMVGLKFSIDSKNLENFLNAKIYTGDYVVTKNPEKKYEVKGLRYKLEGPLRGKDPISGYIWSKGFTKYYLIDKNGKNMKITTKDMNLKKTFEIVGVGSE